MMSLTLPWVMNCFAVARSERHLSSARKNCSVLQPPPFPPASYHPNGIADTSESNADTPLLQLLDEVQQFISRADIDEVDGSGIQKHALHVRPRSQRRLQRRPDVANTREEEISSYSPYQEPWKGDRLRMTLDAAIGLGARKLAELRAPRVAGEVDQGH